MSNRLFNIEYGIGNLFIYYLLPIAIINIIYLLGSSNYKCFHNCCEFKDYLNNKCMDNSTQNTLCNIECLKKDRPSDLVDYLLPRDNNHYNASFRQYINTELYCNVIIFGILLIILLIEILYHKMYDNESDETTPLLVG